MSVILNEVKNLVESMGWKTEILRLMPQNDITTQSRGRRGWGPPNPGRFCGRTRYRRGQNTETRC